MNETNKEYHSDYTHLSSSMLKVFLRSPLEYQARYITRRIADAEPTPAMIIGTAVHCMVLEPSEFWRRHALAPDVDRRTKDGKECYERFRQESSGKTIITVEQRFQIECMSDSLEKSFVFAAYDGLKQNEVSYRWTENGIACKCRYDQVRPDVIIDIKTTSDPTPQAFARQCANLLYHVQAAHYLASGVADKFLLVVVGSSPPYETVVYELEERALYFGRMIRERALAEFSECLRTDIWTPERATKVNELALPKWCYTEESVCT